MTAQYLRHGGFFARGPWAPLLAMTFAIYTFGGVEFIAVTSGEAQSRKDVAKAVWMTFSMLTILYIGAMVVLVGVMPWDRAGMAESPFVSVFRLAKVPGAASLMNFVVLTAALSGANAALYISSRMLFSLARNGWAPALLGRLNRAGSPTVALLVSSYGIVTALVLERWAPAKAFDYILRGAFFGLILSWFVSLAAHVSFRARITPEQLARVPVRSPLGAWGSALGFLVISAAVLKTWWDSRVNLLTGLTYLIGLTTIYFLLRAARSASANSRSPASPRN
jgi:L-asparagine transporter-like permease